MRFPLLVSRNPAVGGSLDDAELPVAIALSISACCAAMTSCSEDICCRSGATASSTVAFTRDSVWTLFFFGRPIFWVPANPAGTLCGGAAASAAPLAAANDAESRGVGAFVVTCVSEPVAVPVATLSGEPALNISRPG